MSQPRPKLFISYSHDSEDHKEWVERLAFRLENNGVHVYLDQWDLDLGDDLAHFMEQGLTSADRVMVICTEPYVAKANAKKSGGVGYEKMIISAQLFQELGDNRVIPVIVNNTSSNPVPTFVGTRYRLYFDETSYEDSYTKLIYNLHGEKLKPRPPAGESPFSRKPSPMSPILLKPGELNHSIGLNGTVKLPLQGSSTNYWIGNGEALFEVSWSKSGRGSAWIYSRQPSIHSLVFATDITAFEQITNAQSKDFFASDDAENVQEGQIVVLQNINGYFLAIRLDEALYRGRNADDRHEITFSYVIAPAKSTSFAGIV